MSQTSPQSNQEKKAQVQEYFSRTASGYVSNTALRSGSDLKRLVEVGEWQTQHHGLDIATGGGHTALAVAPRSAGSGPRTQARRSVFADR
jgi:ubiquinone/menaquinone biosynthesis C-methylase UbiE